MVNGTMRIEESGWMRLQDIAPSPSRVTGIIYPLKPESGLDLNIEANELNLKFLEHYMRSIANDIKGRGTGKVHFMASSRD